VKEINCNKFTVISWMMSIW